MSSTLQTIAKVQALVRARDRARTSRAARSRSNDTWPLTSVELVPYLSPHLDAPWHLEPWARLLDSHMDGVRAVGSAPPQHGKTQLTIHAMLGMLAREPGVSVAYATYSQERSDEVSRRAKAIAAEAGLAPDGTTRLWRLANGSQIRFTSIGGPLTGYPITAGGALVVDDPIKDRQEANSRRYRDRAWDWLTDVGQTRLHPGASLYLLATRWHEDDPSGRAIKAGWQAVNLKAIADGSDDPLGREAGEALWPDKRPVEFLAEAQREPYTWAALYQGEPKPRGESLFGPPSYYDEPPSTGYRIAHGVDLAYSGKAQADWSVCVTLLSDGKRCWVADVVRKHCQAPEFADLLAAQFARWRGPMLWRASGTESGAAQFIQRRGVPLTVERPIGDKHTSALESAAAWNAGLILVPRAAPWLAPVLDEVRDFTGVADAHDDVVDALGNAYAVAAGLAVRQPPRNLSPLADFGL